MPLGDVEFEDDATCSYIRVCGSDAERRSRVDTSGSQGYWYPVFVPVGEMMLEEDLHKGEYWYPNSTLMVFDRLINHSYWRRDAFGEIYDEIPGRIMYDFVHPRKEGYFDFESEEIQDAMQH